MSLKEKEQIILGSSFNLRKIIRNSLDFAFYLVTVIDNRYSNYILYVESEQRIFFTKGIIKYKLEQHLGKKIDDNSLNDLISKINTYASVKLGQKLFYPNSKQLYFKAPDEDEIYTGDFAYFINLKNMVEKKLAPKVKKLRSMETIFKDESAIKIDDDFLNSLYKEG